MALSVLPILFSWVLGSSTWALTITEAKQVGSTPFIKINYTHAGRSLDNKFEFILENPEKAPGRGRYLGRMLPTGEQTIDSHAMTETFLMFKMPENVEAPCELVILNEDGSSSYNLEIKNITKMPQIKEAQIEPKKSTKNSCCGQKKSSKGKWNIF